MQNFGDIEILYLEVSHFIAFEKLIFTTASAYGVKSKISTALLLWEAESWSSKVLGFRLPLSSRTARLVCIKNRWHAFLQSSTNGSIYAIHTIEMADSAPLLKATNETTALGNTISLKMVSFIENVKDQPAGFRDLGLDFLSICQILNALSTSLSSHFQTQQAFPRQAVPELTRVLTQTTEDFKHLQSLLQKFMDYENGGAFARLQKTWRIMFADKDIAKVKSSLHTSKGALTMTMLLTNINPNDVPAPTGYEYGMLAAKLNQGPIGEENFKYVASPRIAELQGDSKAPQELPAGEPKYAHMQMHQPMSVGQSSFVEFTPSVSEMSISDRIPDPSEVSSIDNPMDTPVEAPSQVPMVIHQEAETVSLVSQRPHRIHIDRSTLTFVTPNSTMGVNNASLQNALLSALGAQKHAIVTQLLSRGVSPNTSPQNALMIAVRANDLISVKHLLSYGADPNILASDGNSPLRNACQYSDREALIELLLQYGADPNLSAPDLSPFFFALLEKNEKIVSMLLTYGADPNLRSKSGTTGFIYACERESVPISCIEEMLRYGADPNIKNRDNFSPLFAACVRNRANLVSILLSHGADPDIPGPELPLVSAVRYPECLSLLISAKADLGLKKGILEVAVCHNQTSSIQQLLAAGVDINEKCQGTFTPLTTAIRDNRPEVIALLLARGADPNIKGQDMPLWLATKTPALLNQLLDGGADPAKALGAMEMAVFYNNIESVTILLDRGVSPDQKKDNVFSPLTTAIRDNRRDIIALLLARGADPNVRGQDVPLYMATRVPEILKMLLACPRTDLKKWPGVMEMAVFHNQIESVQMLLDAGVDPNEKKDNVFTPLTTAVRDNRSEILALLLKSGADPNFKGQDIPLIMALGSAPILQQLLDGGADISQVPGIIELVIGHYHIPVIDILLTAGANINEKRLGIYTPLTTALAHNKLEFLDHLISKGADPNLPGPQGLPITMAAAYREPEQTRLKVILNAGADVNGKGPGGKTALMEACREGIEANVALLLEKGADVDAVDSAGRSAMDFAAAAGKDDIVMLLLERMG